MNKLALIAAWVALRPGMTHVAEERDGAVRLLLGIEGPGVKVDIHDLWLSLQACAAAGGTNYVAYDLTSRAIARDPNSTADQLAEAARLYPDDVRANPALAPLAMVNPLKLGHLLEAPRA